MEVTDYSVESTDGWSLSVRRHSGCEPPEGDRRPVVLVPGYAMNSFILGFHPSGRSLIEFLVSQGLDVWTTDLRGQGQSRRAAWRRGTFGLRQLALEDLPRSLAHVRRVTGHEKVDVVGCSLGATMMYAYLAHHPKQHGVGHMIAMGGPLRWDEEPAAIRLAFRSARLAGLIPVRGSRSAARLALPVLARFPSVLGMYMNPDRIDISKVDQLVQTVEDPIPFMNRQMARWLQNGELYVGGLNVCESLSEVVGPDVLCVYGNRDGIVPPGAARSVGVLLGEERVDYVEAGSTAEWYSHADLFIGDTCEQDVFEPMAEWLAQRAV